MSRPELDSLFPYSRSEVATIAGVGVPTIKTLHAGKVLPKRARGTGNWRSYSAEDMLRTMLAKELLRVGLNVASIHSLFESIQAPTTPNAKPWAWLRSREARDAVACLVLSLGHRALSSATGTAHITTFDGAKQFLGQRTAIVIDVNSFIREIEERTGRPYDEEQAD